MSQNKDDITQPSVPEKDSPIEGPMRWFSGFKAKVVTVVAVTMSVYCLCYLLHIFDELGYFIPGIAHRSIFLAFVLTLSFMLMPMSKGAAKGKLPWYDILFILVGVAGPVYNFFTWAENSERYIYGEFHTYELMFLFTTLVAVLEATRRALGLAIPIVTMVFLLHMFYGSYITGPLHAPKVELVDVAHTMLYVDEGLYGIALGVASSIIIAFLIFSRFMFNTGAGDFFINLALSIFGHVRGGPAKVAVVASGFMGMISGSTTGNIAATGVFTIPMMKRTGYTPEFAAAVETVASNGGKIMPPIMGVVAFVMAEWLGIGYWSICLAAFIPAFLYFIAVFIMVDAEAGRLGLKGMPRSECPPMIQTLKGGWIYFVPILGLIFLLGVLMYSPETSILYALAILILLSALKWVFGASNRQGTSFQGAAQSAGKIGVATLKGGAIGVIMPGIACAAAGIIIGTLSVTQIGIVLSDVAVALAGDNLLIMLALAAFACFILGMGMESLPAYIMVVLVVAPAMIAFGVPPLHTHLFVFWWAIVSFITPPVAVGAYVAAGFAGASPMRTGFKAMRLGFCTYTLPFMFVYNPALLLQGSAGEIAVAAVTSLVGTALLAWGIAGYFIRQENRLQQVLLFAAGLSFITLDVKFVVLGLALGAIAIGWQMRGVLGERAGPKMPSG